MALKRNTEKLVKAVLANRFKEVKQIIDLENHLDSSSNMLLSPL